MNSRATHAELAWRPLSSIFPTLVCLFLAGLGVVLSGIETRFGLTYAFVLIVTLLLLVRMELVLYGIIAFMVIFVDGWAPFRSPEEVAFRLGMGRLYVMEFAVYALLVGMAVKRAFSTRAGREESFFVRTPLDRPLRALALSMPLFALYGLARGSPLRDALGYFEWRSLFMAIVLYFISVSLLNTPEKAIRLFDWLLALVVIKSLYSLFLHSTGLEGPFPDYLGRGPVDEGPENIMFAFASLCGLSLLLFSSRQGLARRGLYFAAAVAPMLNVLVCEKRNPQVMLLIGMLGIVWKLPPRHRLKLSALAAATVTIALLTATLLSGGSGDRGVSASASRYGEVVEFLRDPSQLVQRGGTLAFHVLDLLDAWEVIKQHPILGHGFGTVYDRQYTLLPSVGGEFAGLETGMVHNQYLYFWWKMGIVGLVAFLWVIVQFARIGRQTLSGRLFGERSALCLGIFVAMLGELATEMWGASWTGNTKVPLLLFLGLAVFVVLSARCQSTISNSLLRAEAGK